MCDLLKAFQDQVINLIELREKVLTVEDGLTKEQERSKMLAQIDETIEDCQEQMLKLELRAYDNDVGRRAKRLRKLRAELLDMDPKFVDEPERQKLLARLDGMLSDCGEESLDFEMRHHEAFPEADRALSRFRLTTPK